MRTLNRKLTLAVAASALALTGGTAIYAQTKGPHGPDANGDKTVTRAEHDAHTAAMFTRLDSNSDGKLDAADRTAHRTAKRAERFGKMDSDGNGEISRAEIDEARAKRLESREERMAARFARMDSDGSGGLSQDELTAMQARAGAEGAKPRGERRMGRHHRGMGAMMMMRRADTDGDKAVSRAEFIAAADQRFTMGDANGDGQVTAEERTAARDAMRTKMREMRAQRSGN